MGGVEATIRNPSTGREIRRLTTIPDGGVGQSLTVVQFRAILPVKLFEQVAPDRLGIGISVCPRTGQTVQGSSHGETVTTHRPPRFSGGTEAVLDGRRPAGWLTESSG